MGKVGIPILGPFGIYILRLLVTGNLVIHCQVGAFFPLLVYCVKKNLATLALTISPKYEDSNWQS
jgi:hypothetical protein